MVLIPKGNIRLSLKEDHAVWKGAGVGFPAGLSMLISPMCGNCLAAEISDFSVSPFRML